MSDAQGSIAKVRARRGGAWLWSLRYLLLRRVVQFGILVLFFGSAHLAWRTPGGAPLLAGDLSASKLLGVVPMADPFAVLQILLTRHALQPEVLLGAAIVLAFYALVGGRVFCAWVCPVNAVTDLAGWLRARLGLAAVLPLKRGSRYIALVVALGLSALLGVAAFEWVSPVGMAHREIIFGGGSGAMALAAIFAFDLLLLKNGWCGHLCPLGGFWALVGRTARVRVRFDPESCTRCGECARVCPEPEVLNLKALEQTGWVDAGACSNCGRCTPLCPEHSLTFAVRPLTARAISPDSRRTK